jgi:HEAT repeat protein
LKAIGSLEVMGRPAAAVVKDLLGDSDPGLREEAIAVLFRIALRDQELVQRLMPLINDGETSVQLRAIDTLQAVGPIGRQALPAVIEQLGNPSITVRQSSAAFVSSHGGSASAAVAPLTTMLEDDDAAWRLTVIATLGKLGSAAQASFSKLSDLIDDPDAKIRAASVDAVGNLGLDAAELLPYLERALASSDSDVQSGALQIVRRLGNDQAIALIASIVPLAADEEHQRSVLRAAERLEPLTTPPQAVTRLRELLSHEHVQVQRLAIRFLGQAGDAAEDSLEQIRAYLQASDESIQKEAAAAVAKIEGASP